MRLRQLFTINLFVAVFFGLSCSLAPGWVLRLYGLQPDAGSVWLTRLVGGSILGFATLMWFGRRSESRDARKAIALALAVQDAIGCVASLELQLSGQANGFGWSNPLLYVVLALAYVYFLWVKPKQI
jgi:hypothetical protein